MDSTKKVILRALLVLMGMPFGIEIYAQNAVKFVPGVVMVKFQYGKLSRVAEKIGLDDINSVAVRRFFSLRGFKDGTKIFKDAAVGDTIAVAPTGEQVKVIDLSHWFLIALDPGVDAAGVADSLRLFPGVLAATPATRFYLQDTFPNDTYFRSGYQWGLHNYSSPGKDIRAVQAWDINRGRSDVIVAVVDGGVDYNHADLDPGNRSRVIQGTDTGDDDSDPMDNLPEGDNLWGNHGSRVAGVIGAITNNNSGVAGIMWNCSIMPVKVGNSGGWGPFNWGAGSAFEWDIADGINWARTHGAHIINMSFGGEGLNEWERLFIGNPVGEATGNAYQQGLVLVAAMGNDDSNAIRYPASWPWNIAVGATNQSDQRVSKANTNNWWGSNYGSHIDLSAPGIYEYSTARSQSYGNFSGTSCATPFVSGAAGLVLSQSRDRGLNLTNDDVKHLLEASADKVLEMQGADWTQYHGYGRINAYRALQLLSSP